MKREVRRLSIDYLIADSIAPEYADADVRRSGAVLEGFRAHLRKLKTPPKRATVSVLRLWHDEHTEHAR